MAARIHIRCKLHEVNPSVREDEWLQLHRCKVPCVRIFRIAQAQLEDLRIGTHDETFARHKLGVLWTWRVLGIPGSTFHGSFKGQA